MRIENLTPSQSHGIYLIADTHSYLIDAGASRADFRIAKEKLTALGFTKIDFLILTHSHGDHAANCDLFKKHYGVIILGANYQGRHPNPIADQFVDPKTEIKEPTMIIRFILTPGHSGALDDLSILVTDTINNKRYLFCGDYAQPQGTDLSNSTFDTAMPLFAYSELFIQSLERLLSPSFDFDFLITGHNTYLDRINGRQWLWVALEATKLLVSMVTEMMIRNPTASDDEISQWVFQWYYKERRNPNKEKRWQFDYYGYERKIILRIIHQLKSNSTP